VHPIPVIVERDFVDYLAAAAAVIGVVTGAIGLTLAWFLGRDARRSAVAAEHTSALAYEQVAIARREAEAAVAERGRRAAPTIQLWAYRKPAMIAIATIPLREFVLAISFSNDAGTRAVQRLPVRLRVPDYFGIYTCDQFGRNTARADDVRYSPQTKLGDHIGARVWDSTIGPIAPLEHDARYLLLTGARSGVHRLETEIVHEDLPDGGSTAAWDLTVPKARDRVVLVPAERS